METENLTIPDISSRLTPEGLKAFLLGKYVKGIGRVYAGRIADAFGLDILRPDFDLASRLGEIPGLGETKIKDLTESWAELGEKIPYLVFLYSAGLSDVEIEKILSHFRRKSLAAALEDPYDLVENVWKFSFFSADKLGRLLGVSPDDPRRLRGAILTAVKFYAERGNMFATEEQAVKTASQLAGVEAEKVLPELRHLIAEERIVSSHDGLYLPVYYIAEKEAAEKLGSIIRAAAPGEEVEFDVPGHDIHGNRFSAGQLQAIETVMKNPVTVITGGPGTGKTTLIRGLIRLFDDMEKKVILAAPTGRAAKRISDLSGAEASTIHRLLGYSMGRGYRNKSFDADILIIDEASMLEQVLFNHLLQALKRGTKVVLVGDTNQLPAIGAGDVLNQLILSRRVPVVTLTENFRQQSGSGIARSAETIRQGGAPEGDAGGDFFTVESAGVAETRDKILSLLREDLPAIYGIEPRDVQIVTPQQEGPLGAKQLNIDIQESVNPGAPEIRRGLKRFRLGDRVMQTANDSRRKVFNGETGWISSLDPEAQTFEVTFHDGKKLTYDKSRFRDLTLAYATTVHKLQGSETDYMILLMSMAHRRMLYRNLLYTGVSRARRACVILGERRALEIAVDNKDVGVRNSAFKEMLNEEMGTSKD